MSGVGKSIQDRSTDDRIRKDLQPIGQRPVAGQDDGGVSITAIDKLVELFTLALCDTAESKIINNDQIVTDQFPPFTLVFLFQEQIQLRKELIKLKEAYLS